MQKIVTLIPKNLVTNWLLSLFSSFVLTKNRNIIVKIYWFSVYSEYRSASKICRTRKNFCKGIFLHVIPGRI